MQKIKSLFVLSGILAVFMIGIVFAGYFGTLSVSASELELASLDAILETGDMSGYTRKEIFADLGIGRVLASDALTVAFEADEDVVNYTYIANGVTVVTSGATQNGVAINLAAEQEFGKLDVIMDFGNGVIGRKTIHCYNTDDFLFSSDVSEDDAWYIETPIN